MQKPKILLVCLECETANVVYNYLSASYSIGAVLFEKKEGRIRFLRRRIRRVGLLAVAGQVLFQLLIPPVLSRLSTKRVQSLKDAYGLSSVPIPSDLITRVRSVNETRAREVIAEYAPDLIVLHGTRIVSNETILSASCRWINIHAGITPEYRGAHGGYWALAKGDPERCGVTVHVVDSGIDTGAVIGQALIYPTLVDNIATYPWQQLGEGLKIACGALPGLLKTETRFEKPIEKGKLYHNPTLFEYLRGLLRGVR